jgi:dihydroflavonol-4-reductase
MKAFVTGSTGLLGSNLVNLLLAQGHEVKALARSEKKARQLLTDPRVKIVIGDMEQIDGFAQEMQGCDVLFHTAAYFRESFKLGEHWEKLEAINIKGTVRLLELAEQYGVKKAIYVSSSGVLGTNPDGSPANESTSPDQMSMGNPYFRSKVLAEQAVDAFLKTHRLPVVLILPTVMLGPHDIGPTGFGGMALDLLNRRLPVMPPGGFEFVDARDVAAAMINAVEKGKSGERYIISEGYHPFTEFAQLMREVAGIPAPRISPPMSFLMMVAHVSEAFARLTNTEPAIPVAGLQTMRERRDVSSAKAKRELGAKFRPFAESVRDEIVWYRANGYIGKPLAEANAALGTARQS